jgi:hypothetical protein
MTKRRSKKERLHAKHRLTEVKNLAPVTKGKASKIEQLSPMIAVEKDYLQKIFGYDPRLIIKDLRKTFLVVSFVLLVLLAIALIYT